jgi:hypothetical protein
VLGDEPAVRLGRCAMKAAPTHALDRQPAVVVLHLADRGGGQSVPGCLSGGVQRGAARQLRRAAR